MIGVYKITSPSNRIYIGQSIDIEKRFSYYKRLACDKQRKLYNSLVKYGYEKHVFEIIEECDLSVLNERERYWQEYYDSVNNGLNLQYVSTNDKTGFHSESTKKILRKLNLGKSLSQETKDLIRLKNTKELHPNWGKKLKEESILKRSKKRNRVILNTQTGIFYFGAKEASESCSINKTTLIQKLNGRSKNNTFFIVV